MSVRGIHHLGVAVADLDEAVATYATLFGATLEHRERVADRASRPPSVLVGAEPHRAARADRRRHAGRAVSSRSAGPGMHHVAYEVDDVGAALADLERDGAELIDREPRRGLFGLEVAFVHPDAVHGVLTEVVCPA